MIAELFLWYKIKNLRLSLTPVILQYSISQQMQILNDHLKAFHPKILLVQIVLLFAYGVTFQITYIFSSSFVSNNKVLFI